MQGNQFAMFALNAEEFAPSVGRKKHRVITSDDEDEAPTNENVNNRQASSGWNVKRDANTMSERDRQRNIAEAFRHRKGASVGASRIPKKPHVIQSPTSEIEEPLSPAVSVRSVELVDSDHEDGKKDDIRRLASYLSAKLEQKKSGAAAGRQIRAAAREKRKIVRNEPKANKSRRVISLVDDDDDDDGGSSDVVPVRRAVHVESSEEADSSSTDDGDSGSEGDADDHTDKLRERAHATFQRCQELSLRLQSAMQSWGSSQQDDDPTRWGFAQLDEDEEEEAAARSSDRPAITSQAEIRNLCENLELKNYQLVGVNWMRLLHENGVNGVLADEMGLGKTVQTIAFLAWLRAHDRQLGCHLLVVPASTLSNWENEIAKFCPSLVVETYHGSQQRKRELRYELGRAFEGNGDVDIVLTTYTCFERESTKDDRRFLEKYEFDFLILDEAHCLKNSNSSRYTNLCHITAHHRLLLTGTPVQNDLSELFSLLCFLMPDIFRHKDKDILLHTFGEDLEHINTDTDAVADSAIMKLRRMLAPFVLRRLKSEVQSQFTEKSATVVDLDPIEEQKDAYEGILRRHVERKLAQSQANRDELVAGLRDSEARSLFTELRKAANHPLLLRRKYSSEQLALIAKTLHRAEFFGNQCTIEMVMKELEGYCDFDLHQCCLQFPGTLDQLTLSESILFESSKMVYLRQILPELFAEGHRVLLFSQWTRLLDIMELLMGELGVDYLRLDGSTAVRERQQLIDRFNAEPIPVFLLSTKAGGLGINLTAADTVIIHDLDFNPENDRQAEDRCHRIGQKKPVRVIKLYTRSTVDENIFRISQRKQQLGAALLGKTDDETEDTATITGILSDVLQKYLTEPK